jgi:regulator of RNase E activity RraA
MQFDCREDITQLTAEWKGERFPNGRPRVPDDVVRRMEKVTTEEAWAVLWNLGYKYQFAGDFKIMHPGRILVGRAVTAVFVPRRPDLHGCLMAYGHQQEGRIGEMNSWVIETLVEDDVIVVDMFDKVYEGTFSGGNLGTAIARRTRRGQVILGGIRDVQQVMGIENLQTYYRGNDPTPIRDVTMVGMNVPCRIQGATCMPGDVVLGTPAGVLFIPPHLAEQCASHSEKVRLREIFGLRRLREGKYTSAQMDTKWTPQIEADFHEWRRTNTPDELKHLKWDEETPTEKAQGGQETLL